MLDSNKIYEWFCVGSATSKKTRTKLQTGSPWQGHQQIILSTFEDCPVCGKKGPNTKK